MGEAVSEKRTNSYLAFGAQGMNQAAKKESAKFNWNTEQVEHYLFLSAIFDVRKAKQIIAAKPRRIYKLQLSEVKAPAARSHVVAIGEDVDLEFPAILVTLKETNWPIDGWHRICLGIKNGLETLPCVILNKAETKQVRKR